MLSNLDSNHKDSNKLVYANGGQGVQLKYPTQLNVPSFGSVGCIKSWTQIYHSF